MNKSILLALGATLVLSGCQITRQNAFTGEEEVAAISKGAVVGCVAGAVAGSFGGTEGAVLGCTGGSIAAGYLMSDLDEKAEMLRSELVGTGVQVVELENSIQLEMDNLISFDSSEFKLSHEILPALRSISKVMSEYPESKLKVKGFADASGNFESNVKLSKDRASAVAKYILDHGIADNRVDVFAFGIQDPLCSNESSQGRACNRRVELELF